MPPRRSRQMSSQRPRGGWAKSPAASPRALRAGIPPSVAGAPSVFPKAHSLAIPPRPRVFHGSSIFPPVKPSSLGFLQFPLGLAGEEGFEPPHPVLETGGLPLNLLPFTLSHSRRPRLRVKP